MTDRFRDDPSTSWNERSNGRSDNDACDRLQPEISALLDRELDEKRAVRVLGHLEMCSRCRGFMSVLQEQLGMHRELWGRIDDDQDPFAGDLFSDADCDSVDADKSFVRQLVDEGSERIAENFYQLGRAYILLTTSKSFVHVVCREAVPIPEFRQRGKALLDGVTGAGDAAGSADPSGDDGERQRLMQSRRLLEDRLDSVDTNLEKGRCLLRGAIRLRKPYAAAQIWLGQSFMKSDDLETAKRIFEAVLREATSDANGPEPVDPVTKVALRMYALEALGMIAVQKRQYRIARSHFRTIVDADVCHVGFWTPYWNLGYAALLDGDGMAAEDAAEDAGAVSGVDCDADYHAAAAAECADAFEQLYARFPKVRRDAARVLNLRPTVASKISQHPLLKNRLGESCPDWFGPDAQLDAEEDVCFSIVSQHDCDGPSKGGLARRSTVGEKPR